MFSKIALAIFFQPWGRYGGSAPIEGGSGKAVGFEARGKAFPPHFTEKGLYSIYFY
jgi:hypothetical protein